MGRRARFTLPVAIFAVLLMRLALAAAPAEAALPVSWYFQDTALDATSVSLCWGGESYVDYTSWDVRRAPGTARPSPAASPVATVPGNPHGACYTANGLVTDEPYTFSVIGHGPSGDSDSATITLAARTHGMFILDGSSREKFPWDTDEMQLAVSKDRRWHAIFPYTANTSSGKFEWTFYSSKAGSGWTNPELVAGSLESSLAAGASSVAVTWSANLHRYAPRYRFRSSSASTFAARHSVPGSRAADTIYASTLDRHGHLHVLYGRDTDPAAIYASNATGRWRKQTIAGTRGCDTGFFWSPCPRRPLLAYDSTSDRIVVVAQGGKVVRIASKKSTAGKFGALRAIRAVNSRHLIATSLTSRGNRITLGLASKPGVYTVTPAQGPFYVYADGQVVRIPGTSANDDNLLVAASSPYRVKLAWRRTSAAWDRSQQGIWTGESVRNRKTGRWTIQNISHRSDSHYDELKSLAVTAAGRPLIAYVRLQEVDVAPPYGSH